MNDNDNYYRRRIEEELAAANVADSQTSAQIHRDMARRYRDMLHDKLQLVGEPAEIAQFAREFSGDRL